MKHLLRIIIPCILLIFVLVSWNKSAKVKNNPSNKDRMHTKTTAASIDGAWEVVWATYNGKIQGPQKYRQFKMFNNGIFSLFAIDSSGKIAYAGYGKYELTGNTYKETFVYHDNPQYRGGTDWQEYTLTGDTLYMKGFIKVLINGRDETASATRHEEKRVRVKW